MTLEELAKWHVWGEIGDCDHTAAAATIRAAMGEIERLRGPVTQYAKGYGPGDGDRAALNQKGPQDAD